MDQVKGLVQSRVFWSNLVAGACFLMSMMGKTPPVDQTASTDLLTTASTHVVDLVGIASTIFSTWFRVAATAKVVSVLPPKV